MFGAQAVSAALGKSEMPAHLRSIWDPQFRPLPCRPGSVTPSKQDSLPPDRQPSPSYKHTKPHRLHSPNSSKASQSQSQRSQGTVLGALATETRRRSPAGSLERATERLFDQFTVHSRYFTPPTGGDDDAEEASEAIARRLESASEDSAPPNGMSDGEGEREGDGDCDGEGYKPPAEDENTLVSELEDVEPPQEDGPAPVSDAEDIELPTHLLLGTRAPDDSATESLSFSSPTPKPKPKPTATGAGAGAPPPGRQALNENSSSFDSLSCTSPPPALLPPSASLRTSHTSANRPTVASNSINSPSSRNAAIDLLVAPGARVQMPSKGKCGTTASVNSSGGDQQARSSTSRTSLTPPSRICSNSALKPAQSRSAQSTSGHSIPRPSDRLRSSFDAFRYSKERCGGRADFSRGDHHTSHLSDVLEQYEATSSRADGGGPDDDEEPYFPPVEKRLSNPATSNSVTPATASSSITNTVDTASASASASSTRTRNAAFTCKRSNIFSNITDDAPKRPRCDPRSASQHGVAMIPELPEYDLFSSGRSASVVRRTRATSMLSHPPAAGAAEESCSEDDVQITHQSPAPAIGHESLRSPVAASECNAASQHVASASSTGSKELIARYLNSLAQAPPLSASGSFSLTQLQSQSQADTPSRDREPAMRSGSGSGSGGARRSLQSTPVSHSSAAHRLSGGSGTRTRTPASSARSKKHSSTSTPRGQRSITQFIAGFQAKKASG